MFLPLATTAFGGLEGFFSRAIIAYGVSECRGLRVGPSKVRGFRRSAAGQQFATQTP